MRTSFNAGIFGKVFAVSLMPLIAFSSVSMLASEEIQKFIAPPAIIEPDTGIHIVGVDTSNKSTDEIVRDIQETIADQSGDVITIKVGEDDWKIPVKNLAIDYKIPETIEAAYLLNKESSRSDLPLIFEYNDFQLTKYLEAMAKEYNQEVKNAKVILKENKELELVADEKGIEFNIDNAREAVKSLIAGGLRDTNIELNLTENDARIKMPDIKDINKAFVSFSTKPDPNIRERIKNIERSVELIEARVLEPGQVLSVTDLLGPYTEDNGYIVAPVIKGNLIEDGVAGGVCQVSSTIFVASMRAGLDIEEHHNHSMPVSYLPAGYDATLSDDDLEDLKVKNNLTKNVYMSLAYDRDKNNITVDIFGNDQDYQAIYLETRNMTKHNYEVIYQVDEDLAPFGEETLENGVQGITVDLYRIYQKADKTEEELLTKYIYPAYPSIINIGEKHFKNGQASDSTDQTENNKTGHLG